MKHLKSLLLFLAFVPALFSCDNNDELLEDLENPSIYDAEILVSEDGVANVTNAFIDVSNKFDLKIKLTFKSDVKKMRRLYVTENVLGQGANLYTPNISFDDKADGSIDLGSADKKEFVFIIPIDAPSTITDGTVVYKFWTTSNRGDFRDETKNLSLGAATLTLNYGSKTNAQAPVKEFSAKLLQAPLADGTSNTFISLLDGEVYKMSQGVEFIAYWDFGFLYGATTQAGLYSISNYPSLAFDVSKVNTEGDKLNVTKFKLSTTTVAEFDAILNSNELATINSQDITSTKVQSLKVGDIIEFVDNYGKKGLIKVVEIKESMGTDGFIKINIKMQA